MTIDSNLMCDALDDLADFYAEPPDAPTVWNVPRGFVALHTRARTLCAPLSPAARRHVRPSLLPGAVGVDPGFLAIVAPDLLLQIATRVAAAVSTAPYSAVPGARNALRSDLHATGVI